MGKFILLAFKNAFRNKKRAITLGINYTVVSILLLLVFSFSNGARINISSNLIRGTAGHLTLSGEYVIDRRAYLGIKKYDEITSEIKKLFPDSTVLPRYNFSSALYYNGISKRLSYTGIDVENDTSFEKEISFAQGSWDDFKNRKNAIILPKSVADYYELKNGEDVIISRRTRFGAFNTGILNIAGIHETANTFIKDIVLCHFDFLQSLDLAQEDTATNLFVYFPDTNNINEKRELLLNALSKQDFEVSRPKSNEDAISAVTAASPKYAIEDTDQNIIRITISTIDEILGILATILSAVNAIGGFLAAILLFIIAVSIFINLRMTINERLREIGTMRTIGVERKGITMLFIIENTALALIFTLAGMLLAVLIIFLLGFITLPLDSDIAIVLNEGHLVLVPGIVDMIFIMIIIAVYTAFFSFFPARYGGRIKPVDALNSAF